MSQPPLPPRSPAPRPAPAPRASNRAPGAASLARWSLIGVALGFLLPACGLSMLIFSCFAGSALAGMSGAAAAPMSSPVYGEHVSGPVSGPTVAIVQVVGPIVSEAQTSPWSTSSQAAAADIIPLIQHLEKDPNVKAIVLHVNSPGGSVVASDRIYHALDQVDKPLIVYMDELAASGGYYISMASDYIVANPNTMTGSIGVIAVFLNAEGLMEKIGLEAEVITAGEAKDMGSIYRAMTPEERAYFEKMLRAVHENFMQVVAEGRDMDLARVRELADGRIYLAEDALELGLIDALGYEDDAVAKAAKMGHIEGEPRVMRYYPGYSPLAALLRGVAPDWWGNSAVAAVAWPEPLGPSPTLLYMWWP
ncbi:MAG: signal peptide peptidase SppA [Chloroflexi bacterium]|nr:signal peptide peptidase SppA [Chloroflexota bacterium]